MTMTESRLQPSALWTAKRSPGSALVSSKLREAQFCDIRPPPGVRWIGRKTEIFWDAKGADQFAHSLWRAGIEIGEGATYLDFGCSSGRTVRTFAAAFPKNEWHGCDPIAESIEWAASAMPHIHFRVSPQEPPLGDYPADMFDGIYAASVWSHFSKGAALSWFQELHRIIKPGGWLCFSTNGTATLAKRLERKPENARAALRLWHKMVVKGFAFSPAYKKLGRTDLDTARWGLAYMTTEWLATMIAPDWGLLAFDPARYGAQQDVYVLQRRGG